MAELKTKKTELSVESFINTIEDEQKRKDCFEIATMMEAATRHHAKMWGSAIIGFGDHHLVYESGRELDWFIIGFSPRKANISLYITGAVTHQSPLLEKLGKFKTGKGCIYIKSLADIDKKILKALIDKSILSVTNPKKR